eukprot:Plantae.Rhodophyta-Purpureofilum_apyrenoidigerum.ctg5751.p1 GENE.Plantae.Rhodophyta-Purpureofilum_apyrenoidigerum.ctg5751~~Plantae.Rhodophyta-Purpureofilum_apyrenoidigerum.ctg5751.p1  ORF type:complete len:355 (-),score=48.78 Plantae.Rhodophyta-Purpureofilum_apyrenoidigerum.ctg5751:233-1297(-)
MATGFISGRAYVGGRCEERRLCSIRRRQQRLTVAAVQATEVTANDEVGRLQRQHKTWRWKDYQINYKTTGPENAELKVLLIHGFGASVNHWFGLQGNLAKKGYEVYSIDLLGFGASDKVTDVTYEIELWAELVRDFVRERGGSGWILAGNSVGSLVSLAAANILGDEHVSGICLFNCAGGLTAFRYEELPIPLRLVYFLIRKILFNPVVGRFVFSRYSTKDNIKATLQQVYGNKDAVTDELIDMLYLPATDDNAVDVFIKILDGPPGPEPEKLLPELSWCPVLVLWGEDDPWTPIGSNKGINFHPGDRFPEYHPNLKLIVLSQTGHCPHDERPNECSDLLHEWLQEVVQMPRST